MPHVPDPARRLNRWAAGALVLASVSAGVVTVSESASAAPAQVSSGDLAHGMMPPDSPDAQTTTAGPSTTTSTQTQAQVLAGTAAAAAPVPLGVDVSHWQGTVNWGQVKASGRQFAVMKATEGTGTASVFTDPTLATNLAGAHAAGLVVGAYAFARPQYPAVMQADAFASAIGTLPDGSLPPVLDLESSGGLSVSQLVAWTHAFLNELEARTGVPPMIYSGPSFWATSMGGNTGFTRYPLWEAHYTTAAAPAPMGGWRTYTMWQYTDGNPDPHYGAGRPVPGISGYVDQDRFNSATAATLSNLHLPIGVINSVTPDGTGTIAVSGWTIDPDTATTPTQVAVTVDGTRKSVTANLSRTDVGARYPLAGSLHGFATTVHATPGTRTVCVYGIDTSVSTKQGSLGCRTVTVTPTLPFGGFQSAVAAGTGQVAVTGWTIDPDTLTVPTRVNVVVDGRSLAGVTANVSRPDVGAGHATAGNLHGFSATVATGPGAHTVCIDAVDTSFATLAPKSLGCRAVTVTPRNPIGVYGAAVVDTAGHLTVTGWTFDPDSPTAPVRVKAYVDGVGLPSLLATGNRPDVAHTYPSAGALHGFTVTGQVTRGRHSVCMLLADTSFPTRTVQLGCRTVG